MVKSACIFNDSCYNFCNLCTEQNCSGRDSNPRARGAEGFSLANTPNEVHNFDYGTDVRDELHEVAQ